MIGVLSGLVVFSDGQEAIVQTQSGIGYQVFCHYIFPEGQFASVYVSHIVRETAELLFAFKNLREKKLFELLTTVKGVGPKSAYNIVSQLNMDILINSILNEDKKTLTKVSGVGAKAASQIVLDLQKKIHKIKMFSSEPLEAAMDYITSPIVEKSKTEGLKIEPLETLNLKKNAESLLSDTLLACENLGFAQDKVVPLAQRILKENEIQKPEQLVHLVLKEI